MAQNKVGFDPTQTAEYWLEKNVYTVPLRSRSKRPKDKAWPHLRLVQENFDKGVFKPGDNIGALWGEASDHATDIDLDMEESVAVAEHILPETFIYGRVGKEYSHYVYRVIGAETKKWQTQELGTIVEIRSTGSQSVIPPSRHPEGGRYVTDVDIDFTQLTKMDIERFCDEIAVASVFTHFYPEAGSRHDYVHAMTGALCHEEWPAEKLSA
jgi:Bifunctional DNA primase/polymerase, N-terminal.